jgi:hypothetical protein
MGARPVPQDGDGRRPRSGNLADKHFRVPDDIDRLRLCELGIDRVASLPAEKRTNSLPILDRWAELRHQLGSGVA